MLRYEIGTNEGIYHICLEELTQDMFDARSLPQIHFSPQFETRNECEGVCLTSPGTYLQCFYPTPPPQCICKAGEM